MSFFLGPLSGALIAGGVYYGFSKLITSRTEKHTKDLHALSVRLVETPTLVRAPPPASARVKHNQFSSEFKSQWNEEIAALFRGVHNLDQTALKWGRSLLYGRSTDKGVLDKAGKPSPS